MTTAVLDLSLVSATRTSSHRPATHARISNQRLRQVWSFVAVGTLSTGLYSALYLILRIGMTAFSANLVAQVMSTLFSTAANRRFTFGVSDRSTVARHHLQMLGLLVVNIALNTAVLDALDSVAPNADSTLELLVLSASGLVITAMRVVIMNRWQHAAA